MCLHFYSVIRGVIRALDGVDPTFITVILSFLGCIKIDIFSAFAFRVVKRILSFYVNCYVCSKKSD